GGGGPLVPVAARQRDSHRLSVLRPHRHPRDDERPAALAARAERGVPVRLFALNVETHSRDGHGRGLLTGPDRVGISLNEAGVMLVRPRPLPLRRRSMRRNVRAIPSSLLYLIVLLAGGLLVSTTESVADTVQDWPLHRTLPRQEITARLGQALGVSAQDAQALERWTEDR